MAGPCDHICATGTEEQCSACLISHYNGLTAKAAETGWIKEDECAGLQAAFAGLMMKRVASRSAAGLAGTDDPQGGAA